MATGAADYFDGVTARRRGVSLRIAGALEVRAGETLLARWPLGDLRELEALPGMMRLRSVTAPELAHLVIADAPTIAALRSAVPALPPDAIRHRTPALKIIALSLAAAASVFAVIQFAVPLLAGQIAAVTPIWAERRLGDAVAEQVKNSFGEECASPAGSQALGKLSAALTETADLRHPVRISVLKTPTLNAFALPGGQVFLFDGLLQKAQALDEVAGVLGHEIGHEAGRDSLRGVIQSGGASFLLGLLFGDVGGSWAVLFVTRRLVDSAHSRETETRADAFGRKLMHDLGRPAAPMAALLVRISGEEKGRGNIFASHPMSADRLERLRRADAAAGRPLDGPPLLTDGEWKALRNICAAE